MNFLEIATTTEVIEAKRLKINLTQEHSMVSIISVLTATMEAMKAENKPYTVTSITELIRKNREVSTMIEKGMNVFNPSLIVTGTNPRLFPDYYNQYVNLKNPVYIPSLETAQPEFNTDVKPEPETIEIIEVSDIESNLLDCAPQFLQIGYTKPVKKAKKATKKAA